MAAHQAWYKNDGLKDDQIFASRVIVKDEKTSEMKYSDTEVLTCHISPPGRQQVPNQGDAAWNAYVKKYQDTSDLKSTDITCMPKHEVK